MVVGNQADAVHDVSPQSRMREHHP
jgi:hypothetical protein